MLIGNTLSTGLYKLISASNKIKAGDRNLRVAPSKTLELSELGTAFNLMLDDISKNEKLLSMVIENMPIGVWIFNRREKSYHKIQRACKIWKGSKDVGKTGPANYKAWLTSTKKLIGPDDGQVVRAIEKKGRPQ